MVERLPSKQMVARSSRVARSTVSESPRSFFGSRAFFVASAYHMSLFVSLCHQHRDLVKVSSHCFNTCIRVALSHILGAMPQDALLD